MNIEKVLSIVDTVREAGASIMDIYESGSFGVEIKPDNSPVTRADKLSNDLISRHLEELTPDIPVISEEGAAIDHEKRSSWRRFYLVDPLDGTRSFIRRTGEFTINVGLIENGIPVMGIIYSPASGVLYYSLEGAGAYKCKGNIEPVRISVLPQQDLGGLICVTSSSHGLSEQAAFRETGMVNDFLPTGSSLKFCLVAEGKAHIYPRFGPLWEWDTAAGHSILMEAGGRVVSLSDFSEVAYNKREMLHAGFIALPSWMLDDMKPYLANIMHGRNDV